MESPSGKDCNVWLCTYEASLHMHVYTDNHRCKFYFDESRRSVLFPVKFVFLCHSN